MNAIEVIRPVLWLLAALPLSQCCQMKIDQQCYRQGGSSMVGDLGNIGYRAATTTMTKGFQRVSFPKTMKKLDVDISEMKLVATAKGDITASGSGVIPQAANLGAEGKIGTSWDNSSHMIIRIFEFNNPIEIIYELNSSQNDDLRAYLKKHRGDEARIITRVVRAYNHSEIRTNTNTAAIDAKLPPTVTDAQAKVEISNTSSNAKEVKDGTIIAYQWGRIKWDVDGTVADINLDTPMFD